MLYKKGDRVRFKGTGDLGTVSHVEDGVVIQWDDGGWGRWSPEFIESVK